MNNKQSTATKPSANTEESSLLQTLMWIVVICLAMFLIYLVIRRYQQSNRVQKLKNSIAKYIQNKRNRVVFQKQLDNNNKQNDFVSIGEDTIMGQSCRDGEPYSPTGNVWEETKLQTKNTESTLEEFDDNEEAEQYKAHSQNFQQKIFQQQTNKPSKGNTSLSKLRKRLQKKVKTVSDDQNGLDQPSQQLQVQSSEGPKANNEDDFALGSDDDEVSKS